MKLDGEPQNTITPSEAGLPAAKGRGLARQGDALLGKIQGSCSGDAAHGLSPLPVATNILDLRLEERSECGCCRLSSLTD